jgi:hypothetical protein
LTLLISATSPATAADENKARPNTLTPKEIADGWISLFDGATAFGWRIESKAKVDDGVLVLGGDKQITARTMTEFGNYELRFDYLVHDSGESGNFVKIVFDPPEQFSQHDNVLSEWPKPKPEWVAFRCKVTTQKVELKEDFAGGSKGAGSWFRPKRAGRRAITFEVPAGAKLSLRNLKAKPLGLNPIFNGDDLTGWKEIPGKKSTFTVTRDGWLNVRDGPGDLQTERQWDDFVLQLDCLSPAST